MEAPTNIPDLLRKARQTLAINSHMLNTLTAVDTRLAMLAKKHGGDVRDAAVALRGLIAKAMDEDPETLSTTRSSAAPPQVEPAEGERREIAWLIERKYPVNSIGATEPRWYAETETGWHDWVKVASQAKRFASKAEAEEYPAYKMIATDSAISITEHVWLNDSFSWSHGRQLEAEPTEGVSELVAALTRRADKVDGTLLDYYGAAERQMSRDAAAALTSQSAELLSLRRKVEEAEAERDEALAEIERMIPNFVAYEYLESPAGREMAEARVAVLEKALEPFARADRAVGDEPGPFRFETDRGHRLIEREHLRAAARALQQGGKAE